MVLFWVTDPEICRKGLELDASVEVVVVPEIVKEFCLPSGEIVQLEMHWGSDGSRMLAGTNAARSVAVLAYSIAKPI